MAASEDAEAIRQGLYAIAEALREVAKNLQPLAYAVRSPIDPRIVSTLDQIANSLSQIQRR